VLGHIDTELLARVEMRAETGDGHEPHGRGQHEPDDDAGDREEQQAARSVWSSPTDVASRPLRAFTIDVATPVHDASVARPDGRPERRFE
jgi:hypothetical protein